MKKKRVCMFVWNHFTNDARVLRECTALSEEGFAVDLICIHDPKDLNLPRYEKRNELFRVYRVRRYPYVMEQMQNLFKFVRSYKLAVLFILILWLIGIYFLPYFFGFMTVAGFLLIKTKLKGFIIKGNIFLRMVLRGFQENYDIYHSNDLNTLLQGYISAKLRFKKRKLIYDSHEVQTSRTGYQSPIYGKLERFFVSRVDAMIVENHTRAKYNEDLYGFYPQVVHNYPFIETANDAEKVNLHKMLGIPSNEKILLYQGGIQTGRGLDKLIQAVPLFKEGILVLIGDGRIKMELEEVVEKQNLYDKVKFIPKVPLKDLPKYTRNAYMGFQVLNNVCFNHYSASSNKLFEYLMAGVPVVACSFPEIKRVVEKEHVGICVDSHDPASIAEGVNYLLSHPDEYFEMKANTVLAKDKYNWEVEKRNLLEVYQAV